MSVRGSLGSIAVALLIFPALACAADLININTADATLLDTLRGIGESKAAAIVQYRTDHGPFTKIEDIQNVSGIGSATYNGLKAYITVGDTSAVTVMASSTDSGAVSGAASTYVPPPSSLSLDINAAQNAILGVPLRLSAGVTTKSGSVDSSAIISWSFGDGSSNSGTEVEKTYRYAGTYLVVATAADGSATAQSDFVVTVKPAALHLNPVSTDGITIVNDSTDRLDLSGWRLVSDTGLFRIPGGTIILPKASVLFPFSITNLPMSFDAALSYPDGVVAARSQPITAAGDVLTQLSPSSQSSNQVQTVESFNSTKANIYTHGEAVGAPTAATDLAAVGAALPPATSSSGRTRPSAGFFRSPWALSFLGVMTLAGGAFILL